MAPSAQSDKRVTVFVCILCGQQAGDSNIDGVALHAALDAAGLPAGVRLQKVKCLGGCNHSCAIAMTAPDKLTYMYGNLRTGEHLAETVAAVQTYAAQYQSHPTGAVPRREKPPQFRDVMIRVPPPEWISNDGIVVKAPPPEREEEISPAQAFYQISPED